MSRFYPVFPMPKGIGSGGWDPEVRSHMTETGYRMEAALHKAEKKILAAIAAPRPVSGEILEFAETVLGIDALSSVLSCLQDSQDSDGDLLRALFWFPETSLLQSLVFLFQETEWTKEAVDALAASLFRNLEGVTVWHPETGEKVSIPFTKEDVMLYVGRLHLDRKRDVSLFSMICDRVTDAKGLFVRLWQMEVAVVGERAHALRRFLLGVDEGDPLFETGLSVLLTVMGQVSSDTPWPAPLLTARRRWEREALSAKRVTEALEKGNVETFLLSGGRVLATDPAVAEANGKVADLLLHRLWPGSLPREAVAREFTWDGASPLPL